jgi:hypothetical protein
MASKGRACTSEGWTANISKPSGQSDQNDHRLWFGLENRLAEHQNVIATCASLLKEIRSAHWRTLLEVGLDY